MQVHHSEYLVSELISWEGGAQDAYMCLCECTYMCVVTCWEEMYKGFDVCAYICMHECSHVRKYQIFFISIPTPLCVSPSRPLPLTTLLSPPLPPIPPRPPRCLPLPLQLLLSRQQYQYLHSPGYNKLLPHTLCGLCRTSWTCKALCWVGSDNLASITRWRECLVLLQQGVY